MKCEKHHTHVLQDLDIVHCAVLVNTNHCIVNIIMNEYACYCQGQIGWSNNFVDGKSIQVGGKQRLITIDDYILPLVSKEGLIYSEFIGKPTNEDLASHPLVHLTSPHQ